MNWRFSSNFRKTGYYKAFVLVKNGWHFYRDGQYVYNPTKADLYPSFFKVGFERIKI